MKKSDLREGDQVELRDGWESMVFLTRVDKLIIEDDVGNIDITSEFNSDMYSFNSTDSDIMKVYRDNKLIWERENV